MLFAISRSCLEILIQFTFGRMKGEVLRSSAEKKFLSLLEYSEFCVLSSNVFPISFLLFRYFYSIFQDYIVRNLKLVCNSMQLLDSAPELPFGPILNLIDAKSIPIIGVRFPSSRSVLDARLLMLATRVPLMSLMRAVTHVCATIRRSSS